MIEQEVGRDQSADRMAEQEDGLAGLPLLDHFQVLLEGIGKILETFDEFPAPFGLPVADLVHPVHDVSARDEVLDHVQVASRVLAQPVDDGQHSLRRLFRQPGLVVNEGIPDSLELAFDVIHHRSFAL